MDIQTLSNIMIAVTVGVSLHSLAEPINIKKRVDELNSILDRVAYTGALKIPFTLDTAIKSLLFGLSIILITALATYVIVSQLSITLTMSMLIVIGLLLFKEIINTLQIDSYHAEIGKVIDVLKKNTSID